MERIQKLEEKVNEMSNDLKRLKGKVKKLQESGQANESGSAAKSNEIKYSGLTILEIKDLVGNNDSLQTITEVVLKKLFSEDELINCSITGKNTIKSNGKPRPALDQTRFTIFMDIVKSKAKEAQWKDIIEKVQNILKVLN